MNLDGVAAIVAGGASGLGGATAAALAQQGAHVAIFDLNEAVGQSHADNIGASFHKVDVCDEENVAAALEAAAARHGIARVLVNCAGVAPAIKTLGRDNRPHPLDRFRQTLEINLTGTFNLALAFAGALAALDINDEERGIIINTASVAAFDGQIGQVAYAASKAGVAGMTLPLARDLAPHRIRVVTIAPGLFLTPMLRGLPQPAQDALATQCLHPPRLGHPDEYADLVNSIIRNPMLNGEVIRLDGGIRLPAR